MLILVTIVVEVCTMNITSQTMIDPPVFYTWWGMGNRYDDAIYIHKDLKNKKYKVLHDWILHHELQHKGTEISKDEFMHDIQDYFNKPPEIARMYFKFYFTHPTSWLQASPITFRRNLKGKFKIGIDLMKFWQFSISAGLIGAGWYLLTLV
jgi:hypothetical protein